MKKGILLSFLAVLLVGVTIYGIWYINERGKVGSNDKNSFIPYNSAVVVNINAGAVLSSKLKEAFAADIRQLRNSFLYKTVDTLGQLNFVPSVAKSLAMRIEGKNELKFLYVMNNKEFRSRNEVSDFLKKAFNDNEERIRKYDRHRIYTLKHDGKEIYYSVNDGMILVSDSELYIEDALKQFDQAEEAGDNKPRFQKIDKYFSSSAGVNVFFNTACFSDLLPLYMELGKISGNMNMNNWFKWGALDGDISEEGISFNGFMHYAGMDASYIKTMSGQQPRTSVIEQIVPAQASSFNILNLSDIKSYLAALEQYRYNAGLKDDARKRKQQFKAMFDMDVEAELQQLLLGEFAVVNLAFNETRGEQESMAIISLKSGGLGNNLLEKMMKNYARTQHNDIDKYCKSYNIDRDKSFAYYSFPAGDLASVLWGYIFEGVNGRFALIEDNYLILASSEEAVKGFVKDYVHHNSIKEVDWFKKMKLKLSSKYNMAYFADVNATVPYYKYASCGDLKDYLASNDKNLAVFSALAVQWSNEGEMLYHAMYLSTEKFEGNERPFILWQTKLDAKVGMKPAVVANHVSGERELLVQDANHNIYLVNDAGRVLWKLPLDEKINSEIYQVDYLKNNKLQYLFSTPSKMYLVDRNGNHVDRFPVAFKAPCNMGITMYDYDNNKTYRIFAPCEDRQVYLYGLDGNIVKGWDSGKADKEIVSKVQFYRVGDKDYIVFADRYRFYILDRKGNERVRVSAVFDLRDNTDIFYMKKNGTPVLVFGSSGGGVNLVDFSGKVQIVECPELTSNYHMNIADVTRDGNDDFVFTDGGRLMVCDATGKVLYEKELDSQDLDFPYVYTFSGNDIRVGLVDREQNKVLLMSPDGNISKGFPINGDSPFSIIFSNQGDFFLFAGADGNSLIKYRVQR